MSIGEVLARLRPEFPEITISKLRFLEAEGLVEPMRTPAGYRKYTPSHLDRLKYVLSAQRDRYLPLRVIRDQLEALDRGERVVGLATPPPPPATPPSHTNLDTNVDTQLDANLAGDAASARDGIRARRDSHCDAALLRDLAAGHTLGDPPALVATASPTIGPTAAARLVELFPADPGGTAGTGLTPGAASVARRAHGPRRRHPPHPDSALRTGGSRRSRVSRP